MESNTVRANPPLAADAMCGGLARWLRMLGVDTSYTAGIDDGALVAQALRERRVVVSSDQRLFERNVFTRRVLGAVRLPVGLPLDAQLEFVLRALAIAPGAPRCATCNGELRATPRGEVADRVPARTLLWQPVFLVCRECGQVFWHGTHWRKIDEIVRRARELRGYAHPGAADAAPAAQGNGSYDRVCNGCATEATR